MEAKETIDHRKVEGLGFCLSFHFIAVLGLLRLQNLHFSIYPFGFGFPKKRR